MPHRLLRNGISGCATRLSARPRYTVHDLPELRALGVPKAISRPGVTQSQVAIVESPARRRKRNRRPDEARHHIIGREHPPARSSAQTVARLDGTGRLDPVTVSGYPINY